MIRVLLISLIINLTSPILGFAGIDFPVPKELEPRVHFWIDVFTKYAMHQRIVHDADVPHRIYTVLDLSVLYPEGLTEEEEEDILEEETERISMILKKLAYRSAEQKLNPEEIRILSMFGRNPNRYVLLRAAQYVRVQDGMREPFRQSLIRSGRYLSLFRKIMRDHGLPEEIAYLPHVESSYEPGAYSKYGAAGIWQFTRLTGQYYMKILRDVDERRDFVVSTKAAARLLRTNFRTLKTWPLALMAYNYGLTGIHNAVLKLETRDFMTLINRFRSRRFGFASKNFYAEFIAAMRISQNPTSYFGALTPDPPLRFDTVVLNRAESIDSVLNRYAVNLEDFRNMNAALSSRVYRRERWIPEGTKLYFAHTSYPEPLAETDPADSMITNMKRTAEDSTQAKGFLAGVTQSIGSWFDRVFRAGNVDKHPEKDSAAAAHAFENPWTEVLSPLQSLATAVSAPPSSIGLHRPSYEVQGDILVVQPDETLGHYAEWLELSAPNLRMLNGLNSSEPIRVGQRLRIKFTFVSNDDFFNRRYAYHANLQSEYLEQHLLEGSQVHKIQNGETLWSVAHRRYDVPLWLLLAYNESKRENPIHPGDEVIIPIMQKRESPGTQPGGM